MSAALAYADVDERPLAPANDNRSLSYGVSQGVLDANRRMATGLDPWAGLRTITPGAGGYGSGGYAPGADPWNVGGLNLRQTTPTGLFSPDGLSVLGAGAGAFFSGYQSGSPFSGGLSGALAGFGAAPAIAGAFPALAGLATPLGLAGGALAGPVGGFLGSRQQRSAA